MYTEHFHLTDLPFENTLDPRFLFLSETHKEVLSALLYFAKERKGFALVCGDVGTGKTMLINTFLSRLPDSVRAIVISNPEVDYQEILLHVAGSLGIAEPPNRLLKLIDEVKTALQERNQQGIRYLLLIDEAHLLSDQSLEHIRLLSNIETSVHKLLPILLAGQIELTAKLNRPGLRQLRQRININRFLSPMDSRETAQYVDHRLRVAGGTFESCFESSCTQPLYRLTGGVPRCVNALCDNALLICRAANQPRVNRRILLKAQEALRSDILFAKKTGERNTIGHSVWKAAAAAGPYVALLVALGLAGQAGLLGPGIQRALVGASPTGLTAPAEDPVQSKLDSTPVMKGKGVFGHVKPPSPEQDVQQASSAEAPPPPAATHLRPSEVPQPGAVENSASPESLSQALEPKIQEDQATTSDAQIGTGKPSGELPDAVSGDPPVVAVQEGVGDESSSIDPEDSSSAPSSAKTAESLVSGVQAEGDQGVLQRPSRVRVKPGETITGIARQWYPQNPQAGLLEILRANPGIVDANLIRPGQVLKLTESAP